MLGIILVVVALACAFTFPAFLIDAIRAEDDETAKSARNMSCITFGVLMLVIGVLIIACNI